MVKPKTPKPTAIETVNVGAAAARRAKEKAQATSPHAAE